MIHIENRYLPALIPFLQSMKLAGAASRARSKLLAMALTAFQDLAASEQELVSEYAVLDEQGQPVIAEDGSFDLNDPTMVSHYLTEREALLAEQAHLSGPTYSEHLAQLQNLLTTYPVELAGDEAEVYDRLCDAVEAALSEKELA